jgi:hypothetical protein
MDVDLAQSPEAVNASYTPILGILKRGENRTKHLSSSGGHQAQQGSLQSSKICSIANNYRRILDDNICIRKWIIF